MKIACHDGQLKSMGNVSTKRRTQVDTRRKQSTKSTSLAKEKLWSHKLHSLKNFYKRAKKRRHSLHLDMQDLL